MKFSPIIKPNLPERKVSLAAVSCTALETKEYLLSRAVSVLEISPSPLISDGTAAHADLHLLHLGGRRLFISFEQRESGQRLTVLGFDVNILPAPLGARYPGDVPLNAAIVGDTAILNPRTVCADIDFSSKTVIPVRQGYSKCSVAPVTARAVITDDPAIAAALRKSGFDVLSVSKGDVLLPGREYGFIGGCCGLIAPDIMLFNGDLASHRDAGEIESFLAKHGVRAESAGNFPLTDIGGILPLAEQITENISENRSLF